MLAYIILGIVLGLPLLLGIIFRVNPSFIFFSILAGELLARYFGHEAELVVRLAFKDEAALAYGELALIILPIVLTALFLKKTLPRGGFLLYAIPFLIMGFVLAAFALPLFPESIQSQVSTIQFGERLLESSDTIVGAVVIIQLLTLWAMNRAKPKESAKKKRS